MIIIFKSYYEISNTIFLIIALLKLLLKKLDGALNKYQFYSIFSIKFDSVDLEQNDFDSTSLKLSSHFVPVCKL